MKQGMTLFLLMFFVPWMLHAQEAPQTISLQQAVEFAIKHNKELQSSQMNIDLYRQKVRESVSQGLPQVNGTVTYSTNFGYKMDFGGQAIKMKDQSNLTVGLQQLLFSGQWILGMQTSKIAVRLTEQEVETTELDIIENIYNSYYTVLVSERMLDILRQNLENMNEIYKHTDNMYKAGTVEVTDVDQIRINVGQLKNSLLSMERTVAVNYNLLRLQLGLEAGTPIKLTDALNVFLENDKSTRLYVEKFDINNNLSYQLITTQTELNKKMLGLEKWSYAPTISGNYNFNYKILKPALDMSPKHTAGLTMNIPIFSGLQRDSKVKQAKITLEQSIYAEELVARPIERTRRTIEIQLEKRHGKLQPAKRKHRCSHAGVKKLPKEVRTRSRFQSGLNASKQQLPASRNKLHGSSSYIITSTSKLGKIV